MRPEWCSDFPVQLSKNLCNEPDTLIYIRHRQTSSSLVYAVAFTVSQRPHGN